MSTLPLPAPTPVDALSGTGRSRPPAPGELQGGGSIPPGAVAAVLLAVVGVVSIWPTDLLLWSLWTTDPLKSIGVFVPFVSLWQILRVWRALGWETHGSWWGLAIVAITIAAVHLRDGAVLELVVTPSWSITLPPHSLVAVAYAGGLALLFGGTRLCRAGWFPIALMLLVNPLPHVFNRFVDLPLQHASALVARGLAHGLGQRLTPDQLYLMFTPDFGMFIAPGCNGIRGSVTMGLIALVAGFLYGLRVRVWAGMVAGAVALGYVFNLLRLCVLVLYYVVALHWRWLQGHAEGADYCIGATLFFFAAMLLFATIRRFHPDGGLRLPPLRFRPAKPPVRPAGDVAWRIAALTAVLLVTSAPYARAWLKPRPAAPPQVSFPAQIGNYHLRRRWPEKLETGQTLYEWAEYAEPGATSAIAVGVSPVLGAHDTLLCHAARGENWLWHGTMPLPTRDGPVEFAGTLFDDGVSAYLEASTLCSGLRCGQWASERTHLGLVYSRPDANALLGNAAARPIPVLLRAETTTGRSTQTRMQLGAQLRAFSASASFGAFTYRYPPL